MSKGILWVCISILTLLSATSWSNENPPSVTCVVTDKASDDTPIDKKDSFDSNTPLIYLLCTSDEVHEGQQIKAVWIAADTQGMAPANYVIHEKSFDVTKNMDNSKEWTIKYSLSKPYAGWPTGKYHVDLYVDNQRLQSIKFQVELSSNQPKTE